MRNLEHHGARPGAGSDLPSPGQGRDVTAGHVADDLGLGECDRVERRRDRAALPHHGDPVGDGEHLLEAVRHEHQGTTLVAQGSHDVEQPLDLARAERRGRFVEDQQFGLQREGLGDLDQLPLRRREKPHRLVQRQRGVLPEAAEHVLGPAAQHPPRETPPRAQLRQKNVLQHREVRGQAGLLRHQGDAGQERVAR